MRSIAPDLVLTATPKASLLGTLAARSNGVPLVVHLMWGLRSETLRGHRRALVLALETVATRFSHRVIANSRSLGAELVRLRMVRPRSLTVLGAGSANGIDTSRFRPRLLGPSPGLATICARLASLGAGPVIGFVGRINPDKGVGVLLDAVEELWSAGHSCRLMLVGATEDSSLASRIADTRARGRPVLLLQNEADTLPLFQAMDIHCLPSLKRRIPHGVPRGVRMRAPDRHDRRDWRGRLGDPRGHRPGSAQERRRIASPGSPGGTCRSRNEDPIRCSRA